MNIPKVLASAAKVKATEATVEIGEPTVLIVRGELRTLFASTVSAADFEEGVIRRLGAFKRDELKSAGRCQWQFEEQGIGRIQAEVEPTKARFLLPALPETQTKESKEKPTSEKSGFLDKLFGGK